MGDLITMTRTTASPAIRPHDGGEAEILFFTGVRYYRLDNESPKQAMTQSRRRLAKGDHADPLRPDQQV